MVNKTFYHDFRLGILGGGQLGRMLIQSCVDFNIHTSVLDADSSSPCKDFSSRFVLGSPTSYDDVYNFGKDLDLITIEVENVNTDALEKLQAEGKQVFPQPHIIKLIQDKRSQKRFYRDNEIPTAEFILINEKDEISSHLELLPAVQKLGRSGYDGKGVVKIRSEIDLEKAFDAPSILERLINYKKEISVIACRSKLGQVEIYPPVELNFHPEKNLVEYLISPANLSENVYSEAIRIARLLVDKLNIVGLLAVEMFITHDDRVLVNEIAPRPHNSGHHTIKANYTSQFEQHLRAILGLPLGSTQTKKTCALVNILGDENYSGIAVYKGIEQVLKLEGVYIHLYGKKFTKPFRKMGHITILGDNMDELMEKVHFVKSTIKVQA
jgi:5-(carboxyamino)imidazole ribonucleotide synthase